MTVEQLHKPAKHLRACEIISKCNELNEQAEAATKAVKLRRAAERVFERLG